MSKIAIKGNASGTATFTIEAPATNTDRIFELPDEAGKVLTTGNNDPAEVFKQANILGTVSESGGVPTGEIIERDSNANGEYVRFADGTQIATFRIFLDPVLISIGSTLQLTYTPPISFSGIVNTTFSGYFTRSDGNPSDLIINNGDANFRVRLTNRSGSTVTRLVPLRYVAVGRWF